MKRGRFQPLVWPLGVLVASGLTALLAEAAALSAETVTLYGLLKMTSDLVLIIGLLWLVVAVFQLARRRRL